MDEIFSILGTGIAPGSTLPQRQAAAATCRMLLAALETPRGQPLSLVALQTPSAASRSGEPSTDAAASTAAATTQDRSPDVSAPSGQEALQHADDAPKVLEVVPPAAAETVSPSPPPVPPEAPPTAKAARLGLDPSAVAALVQAARTIPPDQLLDLAISRVKSLLQARGQALPPPVSPPVRFPMLSLSPSLVEALQDKGHG